jgi:hypothetical protein
LRPKVPKGALHCLITGEDEQPPEGYIVPLGKLSKIDSAARSLIKSQISEDALVSAKNFLKLYEQHFENSRCWDSKDFCFFKDVEHSQENGFCWRHVVEVICSPQIVPE